MNTAEALDKLAQATGHSVGLWSEPLQRDLQELERRLTQSGGPSPLAAIADDLFGAGGKRLRPLTTLVVADALGLDKQWALSLAESVELTHGATLLHDDVIDEAELRRGRTAARRRWTNILSILGGDYVLVRALQAVARVDSRPLTQTHLATLEELVAAEAAQQLASRSGDITEQGYLRIAEGKTGSLFAFATSGPAHVLGLTQVAADLERFGRQVGIAFQIADDTRDLLGTDRTKDAGLDLADGVLSLPIRLAAQRDSDFAAELRDIVGNKPTNEQVATLASRTRECGAVQQAIEMGRAYLQRGLDALDPTSQGDKLKPLVLFCQWLGGEFRRAETELQQ